MPTKPLLIGLVVVSMAACAGGSSPPTTEAPTTPETTTTTTVAGPVTIPPLAPVRVEVSDDGRYLVDGDGRALYLFLLDDQRTSTCQGSCAEVWPPLLGTPGAGPGVDGSQLGNAERRDGGVQVTYAGQPLYHYAGDLIGETAGHGFNDFWFLVDPAGGPVED